MVFVRLTPAHLADVSMLLLDPRVGKTLWPGQDPPTRVQLIERLALQSEHWDRYGFGLWLLRDRQTGEMVGRGGLQHTLVTGRQEVEVGWAIVPERWGQGLATELARASLRAGFDELGLPEVIAFTLPYNIASRRVMEKTGFAYAGEVEHVGLPHVLYRRTAGAAPDTAPTAGGSPMTWDTSHRASAGGR